MMNNNQYFLLNEERDFFRQGRWFSSGLLDSGEKQTDWNRIRFLSNRHLTWKLWVFVSEESFFVDKGQSRDIQELIANQEIDMEEKLDIFSSFFIQHTEEGADCLLCRTKGRYLWIIGQSAENPANSLEIQIFFRSESWISFLPEIYQAEGENTDFLFRYLSIFQWIYYDMTQKIAAMPQRLYPENADTELLESIAGWFAIENADIWNRKQLIYLIENARRLSGIRGTKEYMQEIIWLFIGHRPLIVEYFQTQEYKTDMKRTKALERLYGDNAYMVTVLLPPEAVTDKAKLAVLRHLIRQAAPAYIDCRLVILESCIFLDGYSYIGLNSYMGSYQNMQLDNSRLTPYRSVLGKKQ